MNKILPADDLASVQEAMEALRQMSAPDLWRVKQSAKLRSLGLTAVEWKDLLNEAIRRILAGSRQWPRSTPFVAFLIQVVRSIASEEWRRAERENVTLESHLTPTGSESQITLADLAISQIHPERELIARRALQQIDSIFSSDPEAHAVLRALAEGRDPAEIQKAKDMTSTQYATTLKRIRRILVRNRLIGDPS